MSDWIWGTVIVAIGFFLIGLLVCMIFWIGNALMTPASLARIEQLRVDSADVAAVVGEDVIGQVTETNQNIIATQTWNRSWLFGWMIPDEWDDVELIPVPR